MINFRHGYTAKRFAVVLLCLMLSLVFVLSACKHEGDITGGATSDSQTTDSVEFTDVVFASGIVIGSTDISGMDYETAFKAVELDAEKSLKDFTLTVTADDKKFTYGKDDFTWSFNIEDTLKEAATVAETTGSTESGPASSKAYALKTQVNPEAVSAVVDKIAKEIDVDAVDSTFTVDGDKVNISREKEGKALDKADLNTKITSEINVLVTGAKKEATVAAVINPVEPEQKYDDFDGEIELIATYSTYSTNTENGNHNMNLALQACDGSVIQPGEVWSFNDCTGNSNLTSLGYLPATVIVNGEYEQGIGGGLCQSSTTIYNAALLANMEVEERYCHQYQSSYAPAGRDATIDYPYLDLKLSNPTDYPMYMQCYMEGVTLTVNIYGWNDPSFDYIEIESSVYGATEEGYRASATRVYYLDGEEVGREDLPSSWYDYPQEKETSSVPATTKPKATKPKATKPVETKPKATAAATTVEPTEAPTKPQTPTKPSVTVPSDPVETTTAVVNPQVTSPTSQNEEQIETATAMY